MGKRSGKTVDFGYQKRYSLPLPAGSGIRAGKLQGVGGRESQQDCFGISDTTDGALASRGLLAVVADGMGGMANGEMASMEAVVACLSYFDACGGVSKPPQLLMEMTYQANQKVKAALAGSGFAGGATLLAVHIQNGVCHWLSVGDSHIYLYNGKKFQQLNEEHNYAAQLFQQVYEGKLTQEEAVQNPNKEALTSYIGIEHLKLIDCNQNPVHLNPKDRILLATDGLFRTLSIREIAASMSYPVEQTMIHLEMQIETKQKKNQDNYTAVLLEIE